MSKPFDVRDEKVLDALQKLLENYEQHKNDPYAYYEREIVEVRDYQDAAFASFPALLARAREASALEAELREAVAFLEMTDDAGIVGSDVWHWLERVRTAVREEMAKEQADVK